MRVFVFSDSHGDTGPMLACLRNNTFDAVIHLGDGERDADILRRAAGGCDVYTVRGNCDALGLEEQVITLAGHTLLLTHGNRYGVRWSTAKLLQAARVSGAEAALFGHTHKPLCRLEKDVLLLNPGSASRSNGAPSYAVLTVEDTLRGEIKLLNGNEYA